MSERPRLYITRKARFSAAHRYENPAWSPEENHRVFGACYSRFGHGHNYELEVTVCGEVDPATGMVVNLREIDGILQEEIVARMDHRHLNEELPEWKNRNPTTENLAVEIFERLAPRFASARAKLHSVLLREDPELYAEYFGPEGDPFTRGRAEGTA